MSQYNMLKIEALQLNSNQITILNMAAKVSNSTTQITKTLEQTSQATSKAVEVARDITKTNQMLQVHQRILGTKRPVRKNTNAP